MDPNTQDNPAAETKGTPETNGVGTTNNLTDIMGSMTQSTEPAAKPEGTKAEGTEKSQPELPAWTSQLPEELRSNADVMKQLTKFGKIGDLAKSYSELESKLGKSIERPGKEASEEEVNAFYQKLGKPKSADKYSIEAEGAEAFKELAYKNNLTDDQAKGIYEAMSQLAMSQIQASKDQLLAHAKETETSLKKEYGNDYDAKLELCKRGVLAYGGPALGEKLQNSGLLYDADVVKMFIKLGEQNAEAGASINGASGTKEYKSTADGGSFKFKGL